MKLIIEYDELQYDDQTGQFKQTGIRTFSDVFYELYQVDREIDEYRNRNQNPKLFHLCELK